MSGNEYTLADLAGESGGSDGGDGGGFDLKGTLEFIDDRVGLERFLFGPGGGDGHPEGSARADGGGPPDAGGDAPSPDAGGDMDAEALHGIMLEVYDTLPEVPGVPDDPTLSQMIKLVDQHPDMIDNLIGERL